MATCSVVAAPSLSDDAVALEVARANAEGAGGGAGERALEASGHGVVAQGGRSVRQTVVNVV